MTHPTKTPTSPTAAKAHTLFPLGQVVAARGAHDHLLQHGINPLPYLLRHQRGDWGDVPPEDARENELSVVNGCRILSSYLIASKKVWIITEADRAYTTILFPSEY